MHKHMAAHLVMMSSAAFNNCKKTEVDPSQRCSMARQEAADTNCNMLYFVYKGKSFHLEGDQALDQWSRICIFN